jgi:hypothetical protein
LGYGARQWLLSAIGVDIRVFQWRRRLPSQAAAGIAAVRPSLPQVRGGPTDDAELPIDRQSQDQDFWPVVCADGRAADYVEGVAVFDIDPLALATLVALAGTLDD